MKKYIGQISINNNSDKEIRSMKFNKNSKNYGDLNIEYLVDSGDFQIFNFSSRNTVVFIDGEIYSEDFEYELNNKNLIEELVFQIGLEQKDILHKLNGSFNAIIFNYKENKLRIINDRFSTRPLFYYKDKKNFIFSNKMSEIIKFMPVKKELNYDAIIEFFQIQMVFGEKTFVKGIHALSKATYTFVDECDFRSEVYWKFSHNIDKNFNENNYVHELSELMKKIINVKTPRGQKYGILLSGGLDSRAILAADKSRSITESFTLGDSFNAECKIASSISNVKDINFNFIQRNADHYNTIIEDSVYIGDGMYNYLNGHFVGHTTQIKKEVDVIFNGSLVEELWQGSKFIKRNKRIGSTKISLPNLNTKKLEEYDSLVENFPRKLVNAELVFNKKIDFNFKNNLKRTFEKLIKENFGDKEVSNQEAIDYLACDSYGRYSSHLNQLSINENISYRTMYDNRLVDLMLKVPVEYRNNGRLLRKSIEKLDKSLAEIPLSSSRLKLKMPIYSHWLFTNLTNGYYKFLGNKSYKSQNSSWPNYSKLIIENKDIQKRIFGFLEDNDEVLKNLFDKNYIEQIMNEHLTGKRNHERILFQLITFTEWYDQNLRE